MFFSSLRKPSPRRRCSTSRACFSASVVVHFGARPACTIIQPSARSTCTSGCMRSQSSSVVAVVGEQHALQVGIDLALLLAAGVRRSRAATGRGCRARRRCCARSECTRRSVSSDSPPRLTRSPQNHSVSTAGSKRKIPTHSQLPTPKSRLPRTTINAKATARDRFGRWVLGVRWNLGLELGILPRVNKNTRAARL